MRASTRAFAVLSCLSVLAFVPAYDARAAALPDIFHVSPTGEDLASRNGSEAQPWRTIGYALERAEVGGGDIIVVGSDGIDGTDDYVETVTVDKSVKIHASTSNPSQPEVKAGSPSSSIFNVNADGVEIKGLRIYGSELGSAIRLNEVSGCLVEGNSLGDVAKRNYNGVFIDHGSQNVVKGNNVEYNTIGIYLYCTSGNFTYDNSLERNTTSNIKLLQSNANLILGNAIRYSSDVSAGAGLHFEPGGQQNIVSGNTIEGNHTGIDLAGYFVRGGIIASNRFLDNGIGLNIQASPLLHDIFGNDFDNTTNIDSATTSEYALGSPAPLFYQFCGRFFKLPMGNHYSDYTGGDANGDGIGDTPYSSTGYGDDHPLVGEIASYGLHGWHLGVAGASVTLDDGELGGPGKVLALPAHSSRVVSSAYSFSDSSVLFSDGDTAAQTTWNGWLTFASPPAAGHSVVLSFGVGTGYAASFEPSSASANVTGDGTHYILPYSAAPGSFMVPKGKHLAVRLENTGDSTVQIMVGGAAGMFYAPMGSHPYRPLAPLFLLLD